MLDGVNHGGRIRRAVSDLQSSPVQMRARHNHLSTGGYFLSPQGKEMEVGIASAV